MFCVLIVFSLLCNVDLVHVWLVLRSVYLLPVCHLRDVTLNLSHTKDFICLLSLDIFRTHFSNIINSMCISIVIMLGVLSGIQTKESLTNHAIRKLLQNVC